jgi:hypothetical protein
VKESALEDPEPPPSDEHEDIPNGSANKNKNNLIFFIVFLFC